MRKRRTTILLLAAIVIAGGFSRHFLGTNSRSAIAILPSDSGKRNGSKDSSWVGADDLKNRAQGTKSTQILAAVLPKAMPALPLSPEANALVTEMCDLHLLARDVDLSLSSKEWSAFAAVVLRIQSIRQTYEAQIATSHVIAPGRYRLEVPAYAGVGDALREKFYSDLRAELGEMQTVEVLGRLGERLEGHFAGFGVSVQTLDVTANRGGSLDDLEVTRTVTYWNSVEGSDRPTTRREVHFPALEDPTGDRWSALLAMVKA